MSGGSVRVARLVLICGVALLFPACSRIPRPSVERIAIVTVENLSANPDLSWTGVAIASIAAAQTSGGDRLQTFEARTLRDATSRLATRTLEGYLTEAGGKLALQGVTRDAGSHETAAAWTISAADFLTLASEVAKRTGASVVPYTSANKSAIEAYFRGLTAAGAPAAEESLREAVRLDPRYGAAALALHDVLVQSNRQAEAQALVPAIAGARLTPAEKARVSVLTASTPRKQVEAIMEVARLRPGDIETWRQAADRAMNHRLYELAVTAFDKLLEFNPADESALNLRGYALTYSGSFERARDAFEEYRKQLPEAVNAIDSMAEMSFYFRRYADAAKAFMEAHAKNPETLGGAELFRAAYSWYLAANPGEADKLFSAFVTNPNDIRHAVWRRWTGRPPGDAPAALQSLWALQDGDRKSAAMLAATARQQTGNPAMANLAALAALLSMPGASPDQWRARLRQMLPAPQQEPVRNRLLGWALFLDNQPREAAAEWRPVWERAGASDNEARILLAASLEASGQQAEARKVMPHGFFPPQNLNPGLEALLYPMAAKLVKKLH